MLPLPPVWDCLPLAKRSDPLPGTLPIKSPSDSGGLSFFTLGTGKRPLQGKLLLLVDVRGEIGEYLLLTVRT